MTWWPWVSRRAFDLVVAENDRLRTQVDGLIDHVKRIDRIEHGVGEVPRPARPTYDPMPKELVDHINGWQHPGVSRDLRNRAWARRRAGEPWAQIVHSMLIEETDATEE